MRQSNGAELTRGSETQIDFSAFSGSIPRKEATASVKSLCFMTHTAILVPYKVSVTLMFVSLATGFVLGAATDSFLLIFIGIGLFFVFTGNALVGKAIREQETTIRLKKLATDNRFRYTPRTVNPKYPGMIFNDGEARQALNQVAGLYGEMSFEIGNYKCIKGSGKSRQDYMTGYMYVELSRQLPHMLLDAKSNNFLGIFGVGDGFKASQKLQLEGDFNNYFTLYCPKEFESDALYIFTPDLMALLVDYGNKYDIEIVESKLFVYSTSRFGFTERHEVEFLFKLMKTVGAKLEDRAERYADERVGDRKVDIISRPGQRLKRSAVVATALLCGMVLLGILLDALL